MKTYLPTAKLIISILVIASVLSQFSSCMSALDIVPDTFCNADWTIDGNNVLGGCDQFVYTIENKYVLMTTFDQWSASGDIRIVELALVTENKIGVRVAPKFIQQETGSGTLTFTGLCPGDGGTMVPTVLATKQITIQKTAPFKWSGTLCLNSSGFGQGIINIEDDNFKIGDLYQIEYSPTTDHADLIFLNNLTIQVTNFSPGDVGGLEFAIRKNSACDNDLVWVEIPTPTQSCP